MEDEIQEPVQTDNSTQDVAGNETSTLMDVMGKMADNVKPESEPTVKGNEEGNKTDDAKVQLPSWTSQLSDEIKNNADVMKQLAKFNKIGDLAKSYSEIEKKLGKSISLIDENSTDEEKNAFWTKLGRPEKAEDYDLPENSEEFKNIAYNAGLTADQAKSVFAAMNEVGMQKIQASNDALMRQAKETDAALRREYGTKYNEKLKLLEKSVVQYGGKELGDKLKSTGLLFDPAIVHMFISLGESAQEASLTNKGAGGLDNYVSSSDGGTFEFKDL